MTVLEMGQITVFSGTSYIKHWNSGACGTGQNRSLPIIWMERCMGLVDISVNPPLMLHTC